MEFPLIEMTWKMQIETLKGELFGTRSNLVVMIIQLEAPRPT